MPRTLQSLTRALGRLGHRRHARIALDTVLTNPHLARDIGLLPRPLPDRRPPL